jgi:hypothetical protein
LQEGLSDGLLASTIHKNSAGKMAKMAAGSPFRILIRQTFQQSTKPSPWKYYLAENGRKEP